MGHIFPKKPYARDYFYSIAFKILENGGVSPLQSSTFPTLTKIATLKSNFKMLINPNPILSLKTKATIGFQISTNRGVGVLQTSKCLHTTKVNSPSKCPTYYISQLARVLRWFYSPLDRQYLRMEG